MVASDDDNDAIAEMLRELLDDVSVEGEPCEFIAIMCVRGRPIEAVNIVSSADMTKDRKSDALAVAQQLNDATE